MSTIKIHTGQNTYLVTGVVEGAVAMIATAVKDALGMEIKGNPDFWHGSYSQFTIDDSRELKSRLALRPFGPHRVSILEALILTTEAQQAILKLSEELSSESYLFLVVPAHEHILPTLRSRFFAIRHTVAFSGDFPVSEDESALFLRAPWKDKQKAIDVLAKAKDQRGAYLLLEKIEGALHRAKTFRALPYILDAKERILEGVIPLKTTLETALLLASQR